MALLNNVPGTAPNLFGYPSSGYSSAYGGIPSVPNPGASMGSALGANLSNMDALNQLIQAIDAATAKGAASSLNLNLPGYGAMNDQSSQNILNELKGTLPNDVINSLQQAAREHGLAHGFGSDSAATNAAAMRALGLTSLDLMKQGNIDFTGAVNRTPKGLQFDPSSMLINPNTMQEWQWLANMMAGAPNPSAAAGANMASLMAGLGAGRGNYPGGGMMAPPGSSSHIPSYYDLPPLPTQAPPASTGGGSWSASSYDPGASTFPAYGNPLDVYSGGYNDLYSGMYGEDLMPGSGYDPMGDVVYNDPYAVDPTMW